MKKAEGASEKPTLDQSTSDQVKGDARPLLWRAPGVGVAVLAFALGISIYFSLPEELPSAVFILCDVAAVLGLAAGVILRAYRYTILLLVSLLAGFASAGLETARLNTVLLTSQQRAMEIEGRLVWAERREDGSERITIDTIHYPEEYAGVRPGKVRIVLRTGGAVHYAGDRIRVQAVLGPLGGPVYPGGFDFARQAWFQGLGAVGYALSPVEVVVAGAGQSFWAGLREQISARIRAALPGQTGAVAAALLTGDRAGIGEETSAAMRDSGLAHLLAISGLHMTLLTGSLFFALRALMALWPALALRFPIRKLAAVGAWAGGFAYLMLTGAGVSTQRAFIMLSLVLLAVILDRRAISMRNVALAAFAVLFIAPSSLLTASFQMSFAAVIGLIAAYERMRPFLTSEAWSRYKASVSGRILAYPGGIIGSTLVAEAAILPVAAYHFHRFSSFGIIANLLAIPLTGLVIMPFGLLALVLMPLGLEIIGLYPMGLGIDAMLWIATGIAQSPGAHFTVPDMPLWAFLAFLAFALLILLGRHRAHVMTALACLVLGVWLQLSNPRPDILVSDDGAMYAIRGADAQYYFSTLRAGRYAREKWQERFGQETLETIAGGGADAPELRCDGPNCIYELKSSDQGADIIQRIAFPATRMGLREDCARADVVVAGLPAQDCAALYLRTGEDRARGGLAALAIYMNADGSIRYRSSAEERGKRPWSGG